MHKSKYLAAISILTATLILLLSACSEGSPLAGSGNIISRDQAFSDFTSIDITNGFEVEITQSAIYEIKVIADDNIFDNLNITHQNDTLKISLSPLYSFTNATKKVDIAMPDINGLIISMGTKANISGFQFSHDLDIGLSTGSQLTGDLHAGNVDFNLSEGSNIELDGSAYNIELDASVGSSANLENLTINDADIKLDLGSSATLNITGELKADLSEGSSLYYLGDPVIKEVNSSRGCTIQHK